MNSNTTTPNEGQGTSMLGTEPNTSHANQIEDSVDTPPQSTENSPQAAEPTPEERQPTTITLNDYLDRATDSRESAQALASVIHNVFVEYQCSNNFIFKNKDEDKHENTFALMRSLYDLIKRATLQKVGTEPDREVMPKIKGKSLQLDAKAIYQHNPQNCDSIDALRQWVADLQSDNTALVLIHDNQELTIKALTELSEEHASVSKDRQGIIEERQGVIDRQRDQLIKLAGQVVELTDLLKSNKPLPTPVAPPAPPTAPEASSVVTINLDIDAEEGICTASIVEDALTAYRDAQLKTALSYVAKKWLEDAYHAFREYELTQELLGQLSYNIRELADNNYWAHRYKNDGAGYKAKQGSRKEEQETGFECFLTKYCGVTPAEPEDQDEPQEDDEPTEAELAAYNPEANLTDTQKTIIAKLRTVEWPDHFVELVAANFDKRNLQIKNTALEILNNAGAFELGDVEQSLMDGLKQKGASDADIANYNSILSEATKEHEPPYLTGLDEDAKEVMRSRAEQGLSVEQLMKVRSYLYPESQERPLPWEAPADQDQLATTQE